jgi:hypothetical protein
MPKKDKAAKGDKAKGDKADSAGRKKNGKKARKRAMEESAVPQAARTEKPSRTKALPQDRAALLKLHLELRHKRDALPLLSEERAETVIELARVEVEVARIERAMDPPLV